MVNWNNIIISLVCLIPSFLIFVSIKVDDNSSNRLTVIAAIARFLLLNTT